MAVQLQVALGAILLVVALSDLITTAVAPSLHGGWLTRRVGVRLWGLTRRAVGNRHALLQSAGVSLVVGLVATWIVSLVAGWALVLHAVGGLRSSQGMPADAWDALYAAGFTVSTLGNGDVVPATPLGQVLSVIASITGLFALTLAITYLLPVLRAAADRRVLASTIHDLGTTPQEIAATLWPDGSTGNHDSIVLELAGALRQMTQAHSSYPVLHYLSARHRQVAIAPNVAALDEALATVLGADPDDAPVPERMLHRAITSLVDAQMASFVRVDVEDTPRAPEVQVHGGHTDRTDRRRRLSAWCTDDGWTWQDAVGADDADGARPAVATRA